VNPAQASIFDPPPHGPGCKPTIQSSHRYPGEFRYICTPACPRKRWEWQQENPQPTGGQMADLPHTQKIGELLAEGDVAEAMLVHNAHLEQQMEAAKEGPINLSDLLAAHEEITIAADERSRRKP
jgi:hypothetical protein